MERDNNKNVGSADMISSGQQQQRRHTVSYGGAPPPPGSNRDAYLLIRPRLPVPQIQTYAYVDHHHHQQPTAMNHGYTVRTTGMPQMGNQIQHHRHFLPSMREVNFYRDSQQILPPPVIAAAPTYLPPWQNFFGHPYGVEQKSAESFYNKNKQQQQQQQQLLGPVKFDAKHPGGESLVPRLTPLKHDAIPSRKRFYPEAEPLASASDCVDDENNSGADNSRNIVSADSVSLPSEESKSPDMYRTVAVSDERPVKHLRLASSPDSLCDHQNENNSEHCNVEQQLDDKSCDNNTKSSKRDLKDSSCPTCGKVYKNQSCLAKHIWEHHESWKYVKTLLLNKHQSVQVMEAAQTLLNINQDAADLRSLSRYDGSDSGEFDNFTVNSV
ncbi:hypothetical protein MP228_005199 [Amoeboaphelidium protococcarum]|nr:hypothetical protein MP228_005199 [Amoeboaphelidium protococcarum]